ncbi:MAG TPA: MarR family transcriptional regulator [Acidimicrobiia bacterium]|nr:MarR family transcriptional regulator [Acidimicrobiia bacterium]
MSRIPSDTQLRAWRSMAMVHTALVESLEAELWESRRLHFGWYDVLVTIRLSGGAMRMSELAEMALISRSAATRLVDKIEEAGYVERYVCPTDRRGMVVSLTPEGRKVQERAAPIVLRQLQSHFGRYLDEQEAEAMANTFERILAGEGIGIPSRPAVKSA